MDSDTVCSFKVDSSFTVVSNLTASLTCPSDRQQKLINQSYSDLLSYKPPPKNRAHPSNFKLSKIDKYKIWKIQVICYSAMLARALISVCQSVHIRQK